MNFRLISRGQLPRRSSLVLALMMSLTGTTAYAQSTTGSIFGQAEPGDTVTVAGPTGLTRQVPVDATGRYRITNLPLGSYTVTLQKNGATVDIRKDVGLTVNAGTEVSFAAAANASSLSAVTVTASSLPAIDVSQVDSRMVVTAQQLARLPLARSAEAIALLAPGVVSGSGYFSGQGTGSSVVSFGGSSVAENAYYINGFNASDPLKNLGGIGLPYGVIDQQEVYTGGYSAMYGRSDGGVISQVGKRGSNEWHFGGQMTWAPRFLASDPENIYYPSQTLPTGYSYTDPTLPGTIYRRRKDNTSWNTTYSAYVGGPLIKDRLFMFIAAEADRQEGKSTAAVDASNVANTEYKYSRPKYYAKLDWNITDSNILELTTISNKTHYSGVRYAYNYATDTQGAVSGYDTSHKTGSDIYIAKYTGYITDDLTVSATYGQNHAVDYSVTPGLSTTLPYLGSVNRQDPLITGGTPIRDGVSTYSITSPDAHDRTHGLRLDVEYKLGSHQLTAGIDNMHFIAHHEGQAMGGPGYAWYYGHAGRPDVPLDPTNGVGAPGGRGYYVSKLIFSTSTSMQVDQKAQYLEDRWQVNDHLLLSLGIRDDKFTNLNSAGQAYVTNKNQWAPRLGFSWDVYGDSTLKVFGNLGRYFLALPNSVAIRGASPSTYTNEYFTYTGIDATGSPTGLKPFGPGPVSGDGETGKVPDPKTVAAKGLKAEYQDEAILGFSKTLGPQWVTGAKVTVRKLESAIDDVCDFNSVGAKAQAMGIDPAKVNFPSSCLLFNPGRTNTFLLSNVTGGGYTSVQMSMKDFGFDQKGAKRKYYALDLFLEHPFDGKWQGRVDYTFSRSYGNTEGQVLSTIGQDDISKTQDWDFAALMVGSNGVLSNDRTHQIKASGSYQVSPEWMVSGALRVVSGAPKACMGYFGANEADPSSYGSSYHSCAGKISPIGSNGRMSWTKKLDLNVEYRPAFADHKLAFSLAVFNVLNERKAVQNEATYESSQYTVSNTYNRGVYFESPRYARMAVSYDF
ncbi:TonB-dependent receptor domain-containing protein [Dyella subtropica]|uniref:TonB-dependent receptor domain-containing protein n=1 Tax=Dyella subtropica TaxID=2992127 RepID=UPI0022542B9C|nr:TonB-dependent receptor [Dyella subtropica]